MVCFPDETNNAQIWTGRGLSRIRVWMWRMLVDQAVFGSMRCNNLVVDLRGGVTVLQAC